MIDKLQHIIVGDTEYPIAFTLNVMESVQEEFGSLKEWGERLEPAKIMVEDEETGEEKEVDVEPKMRDLIWTFREFINEGIDIENEQTGGDRKFLTHKQAGRLITSVKDVAGTLKKLTTQSTKTENPNEQATQNQMSQ